jgi:hypothetical protein
MRFRPPGIRSLLSSTPNDAGGRYGQFGIAALLWALGPIVHLLGGGNVADRWWVASLVPVWSQERCFRLHHAANLLLVVMGTLLALRFVHTLGAVEAANRTLEARVQQREREITASYQRIAAMQTEQAATEERRRAQSGRAAACRVGSGFTPRGVGARARGRNAPRQHPV